MSTQTPPAFASAPAPTSPAAPAPTTPPTTAPEQPPKRVKRALWPWFGALAGAAGLATSMFGFPTEVTEEQRERGGLEVLEHLERGRFHVAFVCGLVTIGALLVTAAGWRRWAERRAPQDLAARVVSGGLALTAAVNVMGTALLGSMALYLPGGLDEGTFPADSMYVNYTLLDFGTLFGWWGALVGAIAVAVMAFRPSRLLPRWMGAVSVVLILPALVFALATGLPGFPGFTMPIWLFVVSVGLVFSRTAEA